MPKIKGTLDVTIKSREKTYYEGTARSVTSNNDEGLFDVLPQHANFITMIKDFIKVDIAEGEFPKEFEISNGVMRVFEGKMNIFLTVS